MKRIVHGVLRLWVALAGIYTLYEYVAVLVSFGASLFEVTTAFFSFWIVMLLTLFVVIYMGVNSVREFMQKRIKLRPLYIITAIVTMICLLALTVRVSSVFVSSPRHIRDIISLVTVILMLYFTIVDFIELFIKKKEEKALHRCGILSLVRAETGD